MIRDPDAPHSADVRILRQSGRQLRFDFKTSDDDDVPGYCVFGEVVAGMDVVDRIAQLPSASSGEFDKVPSPAVSIVTVQRLQ